MTTWHPNTSKPQRTAIGLTTDIESRAPTLWNRLRENRYLVSGRTHRCATKEESKVIDHNSVKYHACSLPQNNHAVPYLFVASSIIGIKHGFQHLPRDLANVNALKNHVRSLLLHKNWKHLSTTFRVISCTILLRLFTDVSRMQFSRTMLVLGPGSTHISLRKQICGPVRSYWCVAVH